MTATEQTQPLPRCIENGVALPRKKAARATNHPERPSVLASCSASLSGYAIQAKPKTPLTTVQLGRNIRPIEMQGSGACDVSGEGHTTPAGLNPSSVAKEAVRLRLHQLVINELIGFRSYSQIASEGTVKGESHEDDQPNERG
jgi:hypothetical protein